MDDLSRLNVLSDQMSFEPDAEHRPGCFVPQGQGNFVPQRDVSLQDNVARNKSEHLSTHAALLPNGKKIKLLKTLLTSACERDCYYCPFRAGRNFRRATFRPQEFAKLFFELAHKGAVEGLFLSSGIAGGGIRTQDRLLDTADILRNKFGFRGYLHLKIMPGAEKAQVERAMQLADRVSVNLEAPNTERLARLAPNKVFMEELLQPLKWVEEIRRSTPPLKSWNKRWPSTVTQFVAGGADESDLELLTTTEYLHKNVGLKRAYFSAFFPILDTPLENKAPVDPLREQRLYQASFLLRDYGFNLEELPFTGAGDLPLGTDPKLAWAQTNLIHAPLELNRAEYAQLLRIPGIGPKGAEAILEARRTGKLRDLSTLKKLGIVAARVAPFVLLDGRQPAIQPSLF
jgi:predicted DNA-binding helix-hairpin-helix protein